MPFGTALVMTETTDEPVRYNKKGPSSAWPFFIVRLWETLVPCGRKSRAISF